MQDRRNDRVSLWMAEHGIETVYANPAHGADLPQDTSGIAAFVIYGGIQSANDEESRPYIRDELDFLNDWLASDRPVLGLCLGGQMLAKCLGGEVRPHPDGLFEIGFTEVSPTEHSDGLLAQSAHFYQWHGEGFTLPEGCELFATGDTFANQAFRHKDHTFAFQFHFEVTPPVMNDWLRSSAEKCKHRPGFQPVEKQVEDAARYEAAIDAWSQNFLNRWRQTW